MLLRPMRAVALALCVCSSAVRAQAPQRLADTTFWRMMNDMSEPWGTFRSENFVSNETSYQWIIPELVKTVRPGAVYLGVAPDQNFTYIVNTKPAIAFIVDIRHQNAVQHLMYKALVEMSNTRAEFLAKLFSRKPLENVDVNAPIHVLFDALANTQPDTALYRANMASIRNQLMKVHGFALSDSELVSLDCVYGAFFSQGQTLTYNYSSECRNPGMFGPGYTPARMIPSSVVPPPGSQPIVVRGGFGGGGGYRGGGMSGMPSFLGMMTENDGAGADLGYLANEANFQALKDIESRNLVVPLTGNFAGDKSIKAVGQWAKARGLTIGAFYVSNVEQYLFQQGDDARTFYQNVATLPLDGSSTFIRSYSMGGYGGPSGVQLKQQSGRSAQLISSIVDQLKAFDTGTLSAYWQVIQLSRQ